MAGITRWRSALTAGVSVAAAAALVGLGGTGPGGAAARVAAPSVDLLATALVMGGTTEVLSVGPRTPESLAAFVGHKYLDYIAPTGLCTGGDAPGCALTALYTPAQMWPLTGLADLPLDASVEAGRTNLDACLRGRPCTITPDPFTSTGVQGVLDSVLVVFGESQSSVIATAEKRELIAHPVAGTTINFVMLSNPNRPNGGLLERFVGLYIPLIGFDFNGATPTNSPDTNPLSTVDISRQYDGWSDFPVNPLNLLAVLNAAFGAAELHSTYDDVDTPPLLQGRYQDSTYYLYPSRLLPILIPLGRLPVVGMPLATALDAPLRVLVETGYDRTINPGAPTPAQWLYFPNPVTTAINVAEAIPTGWDDAIAYVSGDPLNRPFHTAPQPVYGVGGPPVNAGSVDPYGPTPPASVATAAALRQKSDEPARTSAAARRAPAAAQSDRKRSQAQRTPRAVRDTERPTAARR